MKKISAKQIRQFFANFGLTGNQEIPIPREALIVTVAMRWYDEKFAAFVCGCFFLQKGKKDLLFVFPKPSKQFPFPKVPKVT